MKVKREKTFWNVPVDKDLDEILIAAINLDWHQTSKADFMRSIVKEKLINPGFKPQKPSNG